MEIKITARDLMDKGLWMDACDMLGINEWAINEGLMVHSDILTLSEEQAKKLGLIK